MSRTEEQTKNFASSLQGWIGEEGIAEEQRKARREAAERMIAAYRTDADTLDLSELGLTSLPEEIGNLTELQSLDLYSNQLTTLPPSIGALTALRELNLSSNQLTALPESIGGFTALQRLYLSSNQLTALPESIGDLTALQDLYLSDNQLTALPESIGGLAALQYLNLSRNRLTALPNSLFTLQHLESLDAERNHFSREEVERLQALPRRGGLGFHVSIHEPVAAAAAAAGFAVPFVTPLQEILNQIFASPGGSSSSADATAESLKKFVTESPDLENFRTFLTHCSRTASFKNEEGREKICELLRQIITAANADKTGRITNIINTTAAGAGDTCGDRVAMSLIDMQLAALHFSRLPKNMGNDVESMYIYAKERSAIKFLQEKAEAKFIKNSGGDEIETHLAYMQLAENLGVTIAGADMLYRGCSGVSNKDLEDALKEYKGPSDTEGMSKGEYLAYKFMYDASEFERIGVIDNIKEKVRSCDEFNTDARAGELSGAYEQRLKGLQSKLKKDTISALKEAVMVGRGGAAACAAAASFSSSSSSLPQQSSTPNTSAHSTSSDSLSPPPAQHK